MIDPGSMYQPALKRRRWYGFLFAAACLLMSSVGAFFLIVLFQRIFATGWSWLSPAFLTHLPSSAVPQNSGIHNAILGTAWLVTLAALFSIPVGVGAAVYLHEFAKSGRVTRFIQFNIANLAGVPSIVYGILGLAVFVRWLQFDRSVMSGALTLSLLVLPVIVIASYEALAAVPMTVREAAFALGATRWQTVWSHVLPSALPGILTGVILALSRAVGETAPLIVVGAIAFVSTSPSSVWDRFTAVPLQVYHWTEQPLPIFRELAAAAIIVLLAILLSMNAIAVGIRTWQQSTKR